MLCVVLVAACSVSTTPEAYPQPAIELQPRNGSWASIPVEDDLGAVSNEDGAYTGEIDVYEIHVPSAGRLQVALSWEHDADYDIILAADPEGRVRLGAGQLGDFEPEYFGIDVGAGQTVYALIAGWEGEPGPYVLETVLLPPGEPLFDFESGPDLGQPWPGNLPLVFTFNKELDPEQEFMDRILFVAPGRPADGTWCIEGRDLVFYPRLQELPGQEPGLLPGQNYSLQFPAASRGVRAVTGEYLSDLVGANARITTPLDLFPGEPPRVASISPQPGQLYDGGTITIALSEALDPDTLFPELYQVAPDGTELALAFSYALTQTPSCSGRTEVRLLVTPASLPTPGAVTRLRIPATTLGISGEVAATNALMGGLGFEVDLQSP